jgi:hypothetical protein
MGILTHPEYPSKSAAVDTMIVFMLSQAGGDQHARFF